MKIARGYHIWGKENLNSFLRYTCGSRLEIAMIYYSHCLKTQSRLVLYRNRDETILSGHC